MNIQHLQIALNELEAAATELEGPLAEAKKIFSDHYRKRKAAIELKNVIEAMSASSSTSEDSPPG